MASPALDLAAINSAIVLRYQAHGFGFYRYSITTSPSEETLEKSAQGSRVMMLAALVATATDLESVRPRIWISIDNSIIGIPDKSFEIQTYWSLWDEFTRNGGKTPWQFIHSYLLVYQPRSGPVAEAVWNSITRYVPVHQTSDGKWECPVCGVWNAAVVNDFHNCKGCAFQSWTTQSWKPGIPKCWDIVQVHIYSTQSGSSFVFLRTGLKSWEPEGHYDGIKMPYKMLKRLIATLESELEPCPLVTDT